MMMTSRTRPFKVIRCTAPGVTAIIAQTGHSFGRHTHDQYGIGVIHHGAQRSRSGRGMVEAMAGDTITVNPGEVHDGAPLGDGARHWRMLYLDPVVVVDALGDIGGGGAQVMEFSRPVITAPATAARASRLFDLMTAPAARAAPLARDEALLDLLADAIADRAAADTAIPAAIARARALIDDDPAAPTTLADLARVSGLSRFQVLRGIARATGLPPHAYLIQRRLHLARRLIAGGMALADAAATAGFADQSHMTRLFRRCHGLSPSDLARARSCQRSQAAYAGNRARPAASITAPT